MRRRMHLITAFVAACATTAAADEAEYCPDLGLENAFLSAHFCAQLQAIAPGTGTTRSITQEGNPDLPQGQEWADFPLIQDAFRADPRKTLDLIERIKGAGGLPIDAN